MKSTRTHLQQEPVRDGSILHVWGHAQLLSWRLPGGVCGGRALSQRLVHRPPGC